MKVIAILFVLLAIFSVVASMHLKYDTETEAKPAAKPKKAKKVVVKNCPTGTRQSGKAKARKALLETENESEAETETEVETEFELENGDKCVKKAKKAGARKGNNGKAKGHALSSSS